MIFATIANGTPDGRLVIRTETATCRAAIAGTLQRALDSDEISVRHLIPVELVRGFGLVQSKPASACSPLAVTPDSLPGWRYGRPHGTPRVNQNGSAARLPART